MGLKVLSPDVNESGARFTGKGDSIRFGMAAIKGVGEAVVEGIVAARIEKGAFKSFGDFLKKVPAAVCTKRTIEALIKAGAFDSLGHTRRSLHQIFETAVDSQASVKRNEATGQADLFGDLFEDDPIQVQVPNVDEWNNKTKLSYEREMLGLYVSDHPLSGRESQLATSADFSIGVFLAKEKSEIKDGETVTLAGLVTGIQNKMGKSSGKPYALVTIEDFDGELQFMLSGRSFEEVGPTIQNDLVVAVRGRVSERDDGRTINLYSLAVLEAPADNENITLKLRLDEKDATRGVLQALNGILAAHPGDSEVTIYLTGAGGAKPFALPTRVKVSGELFAEIKFLLGANCIMTEQAIRESLAKDLADTNEVPLVVEQTTLLGTD
jgi:DNA polymerase-3 subunit alpha